ncbi:GNAT family N-acetyltransferase [Planctomicrobium sp. SH527]|uniref:GNAT family N-acetyltransferase n=1 Tax=Planctomicrobium sp. SH527 TaxID=3448123 RepID=UPI003F5C0835
MSEQFFKRYRMELDFRVTEVGRARLPEGFVWHAWNPRLVQFHAMVKYECFRGEMDLELFPTLRSRTGCEELMRAICAHPRFLPKATWLIEYEGSDSLVPIGVGTIQGLTQDSRCGAIQNVGVLSEFRNRGLGRALVVKALRGFRSAGMERVVLDVTAHNSSAVELYRSIGFQVISTSYRPVYSPL